jgi:hypothetical protein
MRRSSVHVLQGVGIPWGFSFITANTFDLYMCSFAGAQHPQLDHQSKQIPLSLSWH